MKLPSLLILISILSITSLEAQDLYIKFNSGVNVSYGLSTVDRITFSTTDMQIHISGGSLQSYGMDSISYYNYQTLTTDIKVADIASSRKIKLFPNPSDGKVTVEYNLEEDSDLAIFIYSLSLKTLYMQNITADPGQKEVFLDLKTVGVSTGVYLLELRCKNERFIEKLIIK